MADTKISALTAATTLAGTEVLPVVQSGTTKKAAVSLLADALGMPTTIFARADAVSNVGTGNDLLYTNTIPANTLSADGDRLEIEYSGYLADHVSNTYGLYITFGGQSIFNPGSGKNIPHPLEGAIAIEVTIMRRNATTVTVSTVCVVPAISGSPGTPPVIFANNTYEITVDLSTALDLVISGDADVNDDISMWQGHCTKYPA